MFPFMASSRASNSFAAWFLLVLSFPFIAGSFATFIVSERESKAKHLQTVAGVQPKAYWLSTYGWDIMNYQIPLWTGEFTVHHHLFWQHSLYLSSNKTVMLPWTVIILMYLLDVREFTIFFFWLHAIVSFF